MDRFAGLRIIKSVQAMVETDKRNFPPSRHRSNRIHKKLVRRYGGIYVWEPAILQISQSTIAVHPTIYEELRRIGRDASIPELYR